MRLRLRRRHLRLLGAVLIAAIALPVLLRFPWSAVWAVLLHADGGLLAAALAINLVSLVAKGWAWHLLLRPVAPSRWRTTQEANLVGAAVNNASVSIVGEAARVHYVVVRGGISPQIAAASIAWARGVEALALAIFLIVAPGLLHLPPLAHGLQAAAGFLLVSAVILVWSGRLLRLSRRIPLRLRTAIAALAAIGSPSRLVLPIALGLVNWGAQWATYHGTLLAVHVPATLAASYAALIAANVGGLLRISPGNIGVTQAALVLALLPFGVSPHHAVAAGVALQAIQILPVSAMGIALVGWRGISIARARPARSGA